MDLLSNDTSGTEQQERGRAAMPIACIECLRPWLDARERWRLKVTEDDSPETVPYCPDCATREFGRA